MELDMHTMRAIELMTEQQERLEAHRKTLPRVPLDVVVRTFYGDREDGFEMMILRQINQRLTAGLPNLNETMH